MKNVVKKLSSNNLITIHKDLLLKTDKNKVPDEITRKVFPKYYYYMYTVFIASRNVIQIDLVELPKPSIKMVSTPKKIKKSISNINLHIPENIVKTISNPYFEFKVINKRRFQLKVITMDEYYNVRFN